MMDSSFQDQRKRGVREMERQKKSKKDKFSLDPDPIAPKFWYKLCHLIDINHREKRINFLLA